MARTGCKSRGRGKVKASSRDNVARHNGVGERKWFWGADIQVAASQDVQVYRNSVTVRPEGCGIVLIDQSRAMESGQKYRNSKQYGA